MKLVTLLLVIIAGIGAITLVGCDETATMTKPVMEDHAVPPDKTQEVIMVADMKEEAATVKTPAESAETEATETSGNQVTETPEEPEVAETPEAPAEEPAVETPMETEVVQPPTVVEISYYSNGGLTKPLMGTIQAGKTVFTKVVFSADVPYVVADDASAQPDIRYVLDGREIQYDVVPRETRQSQVRSGDCKPIGEGTKVFLCRKAVPGHVIGEFSVNVGGVSFDDTSLMIEPPPPVTRQPDPTTAFGGPWNLYFEVKAAEAAGLVGNSPLVKAIRITNQLYDGFYELNQTIEKPATDSEKVRKIIAEETQEIRSITGYGTDTQVTKILEELPYRYTWAKYGFDNADYPDEPFSHYWMAIEYFRLVFEDPDVVREGYSVVTYLARFMQSVDRKRLNLQFRGEITSPTTPLQREVAVAEAAGLVGNSPLVKAIRITNRIDERIKQLSKSGPPIRGWILSDTATTWTLSYTIATNLIEVYNERSYNELIERETGLSPDIFWDELPTRFIAITNTEHLLYAPIRYHWYPFSRYFLLLEYLRLSFEDPSASEQTLLERFEASARQGRLDAVVYPPPIE